MDHPNPPFRELEKKEGRPYIVFLIHVDGHIWGLPFRSHIKHKYAFWTDEMNRCGIDYSKAVILDDPAYIDRDSRPFLRPAEFEALRGNEYDVLKGFRRYLRLFKKAALSGNPRYENLLRFSTLQNYYH